MATLLPCGQSCIVLAPFSGRSRTVNPFLHRPQYGDVSYQSNKRFLQGSLSVVRFGFNSGFLPDPDGAEEAIRDLFGRFEGLIYTIADAAVSSSDTVASTTVPAKQSNDWLSGITSYMETVLKVLKDGLSTVHVPYAYGFAIILLTVLVKAVTFPLTKKQVESAMAMRSLQPQIKAIQQQYAGDQERIQLETARLYKLAGINPLAGCLPTLATIPVWIGLYRALSNVADEGLLTEGFFWIPSLAGPTTVAARQSGSGISWLFPFVDGHPPLGWSDTFAYLVLPVLLVIAQYISIQIMQTSQANNDPNMKSSQALTKVLPLMIGYFSLSVPSGLSLYWFTNNILSTAQQVWLQKLGGAQNPVKPNAIKEDKMKSQKLVSKLNSSTVEPKGGEKLTSEGVRPGERFKQLKEEEARRRKQREEEKRKAEETAVRGSITNDGHEREETRINKESESVTCSPETTPLNIVNGNLSGHNLDDENQNVSSKLRTGHNDFSNNDEAGERSAQDSIKSLDKETVEAYTSRSATENQLSGEEDH